MKEVWKAAVGYEGMYEVSNLGRVRACPYEVVYRTLNGIEFRKTIRRGGVLSPYYTPSGYVQVSLYNSIGGKGTSTLVHRMVALAFLGKSPNGKATVDHLDSNRKNNRVDNLRWASHSDQRETGKKTGVVPIGERHYNAKLSNEDVIYIKKVFKPRHKVHGAVPLAEKFGVTRQCISLIVKGINRRDK